MGGRFAREAFSGLKGLFAAVRRSGKCSHNLWERSLPAKLLAASKASSRIHPTQYFGIYDQIATVRVFNHSSAAPSSNGLKRSRT